MKVIHQGTQIVSSFSIVDNDGNVLQTVNVAPVQPEPGSQPQDDPLRIQVFSQENFVRAFNALTQVKYNIEKQLLAPQTTEGVGG